MKKVLKRIIVVFITNLAKLSRIDLQRVAYREIGILNYENNNVSGEDFLIKRFLKEKILNQKPTFIDIGANQGEYSAELKHFWPEANIIAAEPNPCTFLALKQKADLDRFKAVNLGFSELDGEAEIFFYKNDHQSQHASIYPDVLCEIHHDKEPDHRIVKVTTLDSFCQENNIGFIDFVKIDTEGHELAILKGAERLLAENRIGLIQFEFNEMNVISRVFLKDFYDLLPNFTFYRLKQGGLIKLGSYKTINEVFKFQNIIAISRSTKTYNNGKR